MVAFVLLMVSAIACCCRRMYRIIPINGTDSTNKGRGIAIKLDLDDKMLDVIRVLFFRTYNNNNLSSEYVNIIFC